MAGSQGKGNGFFRHLLSENSSRQTLLRGDPYERGVMGSARRARQEEAARHSEAQRSSTLQQVRTQFDDQANVQSSWRFLVIMMMSTKAQLVTQWIGLLSMGSTVNSHVPALVLQAYLSMPDIVTLIMSRHGEAGSHSQLEWIGWSHRPSRGAHWYATDTQLWRAHS